MLRTPWPAHSMDNYLDDSLLLAIEPAGKDGDEQLPRLQDEGHATIPDVDTGSWMP
jgi:hypothetical protein